MTERRATPFRRGALLALLALAGAVSAQKARIHPDLETHVATFGGADSDVATSVSAGAGRDVFVAGWTRSFGAGGHDLWVARLGRRGLPRWELAIGAGGKDEAADVLGTADGGCIVVGSTRSFGAGGEDGWVVKLAANGAVQWQKAYGAALDDQLRAVAASPDGYYVGGWTTSTRNGADAWVLELDLAGNVLWQETLGGALDDRLVSLDDTGAGLVFAAASNSELGEVAGVPFVRPWVGELSGAGEVLWQKAYDYSGGDVWNHIEALDPSAGGGFVVTGEILAFAFFRGDLWVVRLDADGEVVWDRRYGDNFGVSWVDAGVSVQPVAGGGFAVLGSTETAGRGSADLWLLGLDAAGALRWGSTYGGPGFDGAGGLTRAPGGDLIAVGRVQPVSPLPSDALVLRVDARGRTARSCEIRGAIAPNAWTDALQVDAVSVAPAATAVVPLATSASVVARKTAILACPPRPARR